MSGKGFTIIISGILVLGSWNCRQPGTLRPQNGIAMPEKTIEQVQQDHTDAWMAIPGVVGTGIGQDKGKPCILVFTASNTKQVRRKIPSLVDGYPVVVRYMGEVRALDK
jgi:DhnA family fructose-bisphosphate aldolase class Ia